MPSGETGRRPTADGGDAADYGCARSGQRQWTLPTALEWETLAAARGRPGATVTVPADDGNPLPCFRARYQWHSLYEYDIDFVTNHFIDLVINH